MESAKTRFNALDGLRGLAILLVFFNHISSTYILQSIPAFIRPYAETFTSSGRTAVSIFFLLSGFLMAYFYPVVSDKRAFLQKRYTRIFPLFLTMVLVRTIFRNFPQLSWYLDFVILLALPVIAHIIWVYVIQKIQKPTLSKGLFIGFLLLQIIVGLWYLLGVMRQPAIVFNQIMSPFIRESTISLVNSTLTLPLGDYIPMLDGVYWSLVAEVFFYIIFPFTFAPIANYLQTKSRITISFFLIALIPFFLGLDLLSKKIMLLSIFDVPFFYYFVLGITAAYIIKGNKSWFVRFEKFVNKPYVGYGLVLFFIATLIILHSLFTSFSAEWKPFIRTIFSFPLAFIFLTVLMNQSIISNLFQTRWLMFFGTISYSMYLTHTCIVDLAKRIYTPNSASTNVLFISITFVVTSIVSYFIYLLLEKPYFVSKKSIFQAKHTEKKEIRISVKSIFLTIIGIYILMIFSAFQSHFNFFSIDHTFSTNTIVTPEVITNNVISLHEHPKVIYRFTAPENNMGIITMDLKFESLYTKDYPKKSPLEQKVLFKLKEVGKNTWFAESSYKPAEIGMSKNHPFGFPQIPDSKGKQYEVEISLLYPTIKEYVKINTSNSFFVTVYQLKKSEILKSPKSLFSLLSNRLNNVFTSRDAQSSLIFLMPFAVLVIFFMIDEKGIVKR